MDGRFTYKGNNEEIEAEVMGCKSPEEMFSVLVRMRKIAKEGKNE